MIQFIQQYWHRSSTHRSFPLYMLLLSFVWTSLLCNPSYTTDSYEYAIVASCWTDSNFVIMDCSQINYWFRQPFPSLLVWLSQPLLHPFTGIAFWAWLASTVLLWLVWYIGCKCWNKNLGMWLWLAFGSSPIFITYNTFADARIIALPLLLWTAFTLMKRHPSNLLVFSGAITCLCAFLTRLEVLLLFPIFLYLQILLKKGNWKSTALLFVTTIAIWLFAIWQQAGILSISPRYWEGYLLQSAEEIPLRWSLDLFGMGIWSPPMREIAMKSPIISMQLESIDIGEWSSWIQISIVDLFPLWSWFLCLICFVWNAKTRNISSSFWILFLFSMPSLAITILPQARDSLFPQANTFPIWIYTLIGFVCALHQIAHRFFQKYTPLCMFLCIALLHISSKNVFIDAGISFLPLAQKTSDWIHQHTPTNSIILSSYETAPIVFRSERNWQQWPSPMEWKERLKTSKPMYALVSQKDPHSHYPLAFVEWKEPTAYFRDISNEFLIIQIQP